MISIVYSELCITWPELGNNLPATCMAAEKQVVGVFLCLFSDWQRICHICSSLLKDFRNSLTLGDFFFLCPSRTYLEGVFTGMTRMEVSRRTVKSPSCRQYVLTNINSLFTLKDIKAVNGLVLSATKY